MSKNVTDYLFTILYFEFWTRLSFLQPANKGLEPDPSKSPPAQQHFATVLDFHWIQKPFLL